ncbi:MAG: cell division protein FtsZ [Flavobacteriaceae bacterium]|jgi:cell division protein FtsZ|nr:cell division protein FtsZ [Flavobacteriaceae bacterium]
MEDNNNKLFFELPQKRPSAIKVIGVGGGGNNAVGYMYDQGISGVDFIVCNTDAQALVNNPIPVKIQLGAAITEGDGAGANPEIGEQAALESMDDIKAVLGNNTKMVFITAGMGGGTGTGAAPIIAGIAKEMGILTVGIVTIPFTFEGRNRMEQAEKGLEKIRKNVDSLIVIKNDKLRELYGNLGYKSGFSKSNEVLSTAAKGIAEVITKNYSINIDLRDAKTVLFNSGTAIMGSAEASGSTKAQDAIMTALDSPLLNDNKITGAKNVLLLIVSGEDEITVDEIGIINDHIQSEAGNGTNIIMGIGEDLSLGDKISVTVIATGFPIDDERNSGRPQETIYHTLGEDLPTDSFLNVKGTASSAEIKIENDEPQLIKKEDVATDKSGRQIITLEDEEEITDFGISSKKKTKDETLSIFEEEDIKIVRKETSVLEEKNFFEPERFELPKDEKKDEWETAEFSPQTIIFSLDEAENFPQQIVETEPQQQEIQLQVKNETSSEGIGHNGFSSEEKNEEKNNTLTEMMERKIQERRSRLKQLNSKYQSLGKQNIDEVEKVPAYQRQGVNLDENFNHEKSTNTFFNQKTNEVQVRPNNFFHDNVD